MSWEAGGGRHWTEAAAGRGGRHAEAGRPRASGASSSVSGSRPWLCLGSPVRELGSWVPPMARDQPASMPS